MNMHSFTQAMLAFRNIWTGPEKLWITPIFWDWRPSQPGRRILPRRPAGQASAGYTAGSTRKMHVRLPSTSALRLKIGRPQSLKSRLTLTASLVFRVAWPSRSRAFVGIPHRCQFLTFNQAYTSTLARCITLIAMAMLIRCGSQSINYRITALDGLQGLTTSRYTYSFYTSIEKNSNRVVF